ncbi:hypothetical protein PALA111701_23195 [Paenibacillus lactis]
MTRSIGTRYCRGDIWVAKFSYYEDPTQYKMRPVIIISNDMLNESDDVIILAPITSARPRNDYDVVIDYWEDAGLDRRLPVIWQFVGQARLLASVDGRIVGDVRDVSCFRFSFLLVSDVSINYIDCFAGCIHGDDHFAQYEPGDGPCGSKPLGVNQQFTRVVAESWHDVRHCGRRRVHSRRRRLSDGFRPLSCVGVRFLSSPACYCSSSAAPSSP